MAAAQAAAMDSSEGITDSIGISGGAVGLEGFEFMEEELDDNFSRDSEDYVHGRSLLLHVLQKSICTPKDVVRLARLYYDPISAHVDLGVE